jgi:hypothetical protein
MQTVWEVEVAAAVSYLLRKSHDSTAEQARFEFTVGSIDSN